MPFKRPETLKNFHIILCRENLSWLRLYLLCTVVIVCFFVSLFLFVSINFRNYQKSMMPFKRPETLKNFHIILCRENYLDWDFWWFCWVANYFISLLRLHLFNFYLLFVCCYRLNYSLFGCGISRISILYTSGRAKPVNYCSHYLILSAPINLHNSIILYLLRIEWCSIFIALRMWWKEWMAKYVTLKFQCWST
jgi:hypothetical protein